VTRKQESCLTSTHDGCSDVQICPSRFVNNYFSSLVEFRPGINFIAFQYQNNTKCVEKTVEVDHRIHTSCKHFIKYVYVSTSFTTQSDLNLAFLKIDLAMKIAQAIFIEKLYEHGFSKKCFCLQKDKFCATLKINPEELAFIGSNNEELWTLLVRKIVNNPDLWNPDCKYVVFVEQFGENVRNDTLKQNDSDATEYRRPSGGGGLAFLPVQYLTVWPQSLEAVFPTIEDSTLLSGEMKHPFPEFAPHIQYDMFVFIFCNLNELYNNPSVFLQNNWRFV